MSNDMHELKALIAQVASGHPLNEEEARQAFDIMMSGNATPAQMGGFLMALRVRGETVPEIIGAARSMRSRMVRIEAPENAIDTCGTGGDAKGTFNISTAAAFVVAACGVPVAKHGNRALSSKSGAADVLTALGVNIDADMSLVRRALWEAGTCFMMAPRHHNAMRHVGPTRVELGTRTIFNLLGPLCNPAGIRRQILGVFDRAWIEPLAQVLQGLGHESAWVVHGEGGFDEITSTGTSYVAELRDGKVSLHEITPEQFGIPRSDPEALLGGDAEHNAAALRRLLHGEGGALRDTVLMTAAAGLLVGGKVTRLDEGLSLAAARLDDGSARNVLERLIAITNEGGHA